MACFLLVEVRGRRIVRVRRLE
ncbi:hypothetical protein [Paraoerskovia sediminicola]